MDRRVLTSPGELIDKHDVRLPTKGKEATLPVARLSEEQLFTARTHSEKISSPEAAREIEMIKDIIYPPRHLEVEQAVGTALSTKVPTLLVTTEVPTSTSTEVAQDRDLVGSP